MFTKKHYTLFGTLLLVVTAGMIEEVLKRQRKAQCTVLRAGVKVALEFFQGRSEIHPSKPDWKCPA